MFRFMFRNGNTILLRISKYRLGFILTSANDINEDPELFAATQTLTLLTVRNVENKTFSHFRFNCSIAKDNRSDLFSGVKGVNSISSFNKTTKSISDKLLLRFFFIFYEILLLVDCYE